MTEAELWRMGVALHAYLEDYQPYGPNKDAPVEYKTSKEIQTDISDMVTASVNDITEYMLNEGYKMGYSGKQLAWIMQDDSAPF